MQTEDLNMLISLGVLDPRADELSAMIVWGVFLRDPVVFQRAGALPRDSKYPAMLTPDAENKVVAAMSPVEKEELKHRILAKCTDRKPA
jgi:hypothetical protein